MIQAPARRPAVALLCGALSLAVAGCYSTKVTPVDPEPSMPPASASAGSVETAPTTTSPSDAGYAAALKLLSDGNNALGLDVYGVARKGRSNLALSPLSISLALTMAWARARAERRPRR